MRIIIPSKGRPDTITTHLHFKDKDYWIFVHNKQEASYYKLNKTIDPERIISTEQPFGISVQRQWIQDNFLKENEWHIALDDNIKYFTSVPEPLASQDSLPVKTDKSLKKAFETKISGEEFLRKCDELVEKGEREGAYNIGFATTPNFFFRQKKYRYSGYVISKACIRKNLGIPFDQNIKATDDYAYTAECLLRHGKVLIDNYIFAQGGHYEKGGIGTYKQREPLKIQDGEYLMKKYPGLFNYKKKVGCDPRAELMIRLTSEKQVNEWRKNVL